MVAHDDSNNKVHKRRACLRHGASALSILKRPLSANLSQHQRRQRPPASLVRRKALITIIMSNVQHIQGEQEESTHASAMNEQSSSSFSLSTSAFPSHSATIGELQTTVAHNGEYSMSPSAPHDAIQYPSISSELMISLMALAADNQQSCKIVLRYTRKRLRLDFMLRDLHSQSQAMRALTAPGVTRSILSAARNVLHEDGAQGSNEVCENLFNISDTACQFVCCSMLFVDHEKDSFFRALDLDKLLHVLFPESLPFAARFINLIKPPVQSLTVSPHWEWGYTPIVESLTDILGANAQSIRSLTVYLPTGHMVRVLETVNFRLEGLEELCIKVQGEQIRHYNPLEASSGLHSFYARISVICPHLKFMTLQKVGDGSTRVVKMKGLPRSVRHVVSTRGIELVPSSEGCCGLRTVTMHEAHIDFEEFALFKCEGALPQLERVNLVNCTFEASNARLDQLSARLRGCVRMIANDPSRAAAIFPVEGLPWLIGDFPSLEVLELRLNTEADYYICETLGYVLHHLRRLRCLSVHVMETRLRAENVEVFKSLFTCLMESECALEHLSMTNIWVCTDVLFPLLEKKGGGLKTLDVKVHHDGCRDENRSLALRAADVIDVLRHLSVWCASIRNLYIGEKHLLRTALAIGKVSFSNSEDAGVKRMWDMLMAFDRRKASYDVYRDASRGLFREE